MAKLSGERTLGLDLGDLNPPLSTAPRPKPSVGTPGGRVQDQDQDQDQEDEQEIVRSPKPANSCNYCVPLAAAERKSAFMVISILQLIKLSPGTSSEGRGSEAALGATQLSGQAAS